MIDTAGSLAFPVPPRVTVPVSGGDLLFPVRRIYCVGRNYLAHIREMGGSEREPPFFFQKPTDSIVLSGGTVAHPTATTNLQHEIELVLAIGTSGQNIAPDAAAGHVFGVAAGIDLTRRDLQVAAREAARPWECGKSFDQSAPIGRIRPLVGTLPQEGRISLSVNGTLKQDGNLREMIWQSAEIISQLSGLFTLEPGDLIYTGTPAGCGKVESGDIIHGIIEGVGDVRVVIA